jgi:two-component system, sensor histidine kinase and response regulator
MSAVVRTILLAEDEEALAEAMAEVISHMGHRALVAHDGRTALELARTHRPDLIISDYMMPVRNGVELLEDVRADPSLADVPFVLVSAAAPRAAERAWRFLAKPVRLDTLEALIADALRGANARAVEGAVTAPSTTAMPTLREETLNWVAHEIRTPLSTARLAAEMMERQLAERGDLPLQTKAASILRQLDVVVGLVHTVLETARLVENRMNLELVRADVRQAVAATVDEWRERHPQFTFTSELPGEPVVVAHDVARIRQILDNLISNAVKYSGSSRTVRLQLQEQPATVAISVHDQGLGIPPSELPRIFDRFHRVSSSAGEGHGLGLFIASALAQLHHGSLTVSSEPGQGSTFTLKLPRV